MIRKESFTATAESFASERKKILADSDEQLRPHVLDALSRVGLPSWQLQIVNAALEIFDVTARAEVDEWNQVIDDMRDLFAKELGESLADKTTLSENREAQADRITRWVSTMAHNAAMEAATTSDTDNNVGLEWVTMGDPEVRSNHEEANGQTVPTGQEFEVGGEKMLYPGQPVGDPSNWINCRCVARPTMLNSEFALQTGGLDTSAEFNNGVMVLTASADLAEDSVGEEEITSTVIVALPAAADPISAASSERSGAHATLLFLGDSGALDEEALKAAVEGFVTGGNVGIITEQVNGRATLGADAADVVLFDAANLVFIRAGLLEQPALAHAHQSVEQFPTWLPHVTLGYPETPALAEYAGEAITFDRLAVWHGESRTEYPLGGSVVPAEEPKKDVPDAPTAAVEDEIPVPAEAPAPAPADTPEGVAAPTPGLRPWHGVLAPEGAPSGDARQFAERMLTTRDLPLPIKAMFIDDDGHKGSVVVARVDEIYRHDGLIKAAGVWDDSPDADRAWNLVENKMWRGVSVDLDAAEGVMTEGGDGERDSIEFHKGRISAATLCAIPAFAEAFVRNGTWAEFANEPLPTGNMVPIPDWPEDIPAQEQAPAFSLVASAAPVISADFFRNPMLTDVTPVTRGENGHIFGHLGIWDQCHIAYEVCTTVPPSQTDYAYFLTGQVFTDAGPVAVGQLTVGGGHADGKLGVRAAIAHYDNVASAVADITVFEDEFGVAFSGRIRPWATEQQIHELFAAGPSGDWRGVRYRGKDSMELVAAHAVNVQGFPVARARFSMEGTRQVSLVAAGAVAPTPLVGDELVTKVNEVKANIRAVRFAAIKKSVTKTKGK